jgi:serralysin
VVKILRYLKFRIINMEKEMAPTSIKKMFSSFKFNRLSNKRSRYKAIKSSSAIISEKLEERILLFALASRWSTTATDGSGLTQGDPTTITWTVVPDGTPIPALSGLSTESSSPSNLVSFLNNIYGTVTDDNNHTDEIWFGHFKSVFDRWSELGGVTYVYANYDDGASFSSSSLAAPGVLGVRADVRIGGHHIDGNSGVLAYNFYPNNGEMVIDTNDNYYSTTSNNSIRLRNILAHEAGHGLGLAHIDSSDSSFLMEPILSTSFDGPQYDDVLGLQRHYGDALEKNGGNNTVATATQLGTIGDNQTISIGTDGHRKALSTFHKDIISIDDESDIDYFSFSTSTSSFVSINLNPVGPTYSVGPQGGTQSQFVASAQSDLALQLIGPNGTTVLATSDLVGLGLSESISLNVSAAGQYYIKVTGSTLNKIQTYSLDISVSHIEVENSAPTDIILSNNTILENAGINAIIGTLTAVDPDIGDSFMFSLPVGFYDNHQFNIDNTSLRANDSFDFETKSSYMIVVRVTDSQGLSFDKEFTINVIDVDENPRPYDVNGNVLTINGTSSDDNISVSNVDGVIHIDFNGEVFIVNIPSTIQGNSANKAKPSPETNSGSVITSIIINGNGGNDILALGDSLGPQVNGTLNGGDGNDILIGGNDILSGRDGNDTLNVTSGKNILIGGNGSDTLNGGNSEDLIIGARYILESDSFALRSLLDEWESDSNYDDRVRHLLGTKSGGSNGNFTLTSSTIKEDGAKDSLRGNAGRDWYLANRNGRPPQNRDNISDKDKDSIFTDISSWL